MSLKGSIIHGCASRMSPLQQASIKYLPQIISCSYWGLPAPLRRLFSVRECTRNPKWARWLGLLSDILKSITPEMDPVSHLIVNANSTGSYTQPAQHVLCQMLFLHACLFGVTTRVWQGLCTNIQHILSVGARSFFLFLFLFGTLFFFLSFSSALLLLWQGTAGRSGWRGGLG